MHYSYWNKWTHTAAAYLIDVMNNANVVCWIYELIIIMIVMNVFYFINNSNVAAHKPPSRCGVLSSVNCVQCVCCCVLCLRTRSRACLLLLSLPAALMRNCGMLLLLLLLLLCLCVNSRIVEYSLFALALS